MSAYREVLIREGHNCPSPQGAVWLRFWNGTIDGDESKPVVLDWCSMCGTREIGQIVDGRFNLIERSTPHWLKKEKEMNSVDQTIKACTYQMSEGLKNLRQSRDNLQTEITNLQLQVRAKQQQVQEITESIEKFFKEKP